MKSFTVRRANFNQKHAVAFRSSHPEPFRLLFLLRFRLALFRGHLVSVLPIGKGKTTSSAG